MADDDVLKTGVLIFDEKVDKSKNPVPGKFFAIYVDGLGTRRQESIAGVGYMTFQDKCVYTLPAGNNNSNYKKLKEYPWVVVVVEPTLKHIPADGLRKYKESAIAKSIEELKKARAKSEAKRAEKPPAPPKGRKK